MLLLHYYITYVKNICLVMLVVPENFQIFQFGSPKMLIGDLGILIYISYEKRLASVIRYVHDLYTHFIILLLQISSCKTIVLIMKTNREFILFTQVTPPVGCNFTRCNYTAN